MAYNPQTGIYDWELGESFDQINLELDKVAAEKRLGNVDFVVGSIGC